MPSEADLPGQVLVRPLALWFLVKFCQWESSARIRVHAGYLYPDKLYWGPAGGMLLFTAGHSFSQATFTI